MNSTTDPASPVPEEPRKGQLSVRAATFLGIGSMIGAGIFALLGEAGAVAGAAVWLSFLIGGVVAMLLGYVCVKLGSRYPSKGGLITYLIEGFGKGRLVGVASWLGYIAAIVIVDRDGGRLVRQLRDVAVHRRQRELRLEPPVHHRAASS